MEDRGIYEKSLPFFYFFNYHAQKVLHEQGKKGVVWGFCERKWLQKQRNKVREEISEKYSPLLRKMSGEGKGTILQMKGA